MAKSPPYVIQYFATVGVETTLTVVKKEDQTSTFPSYFIHRAFLG